MTKIVFDINKSNKKGHYAFKINGIQNGRYNNIDCKIYCFKFDNSADYSAIWISENKEILFANICYMANKNYISKNITKIINNVSIT